MHLALRPHSCQTYHSPLLSRRRLRTRRRQWQDVWSRQAERLEAGQESALAATRCRLFLQDLPVAAPPPADPLARRQRDRVEALLAGRIRLERTV